MSQIRTKAGQKFTILGIRPRTDSKGNRVFLGRYEIDGPSGPIRELSAESIEESLLPPMKTWTVVRMVFVKKCRQGSHGAHYLREKRFVIQAVNGSEAAAMADLFKYEEERALGHHNPTRPLPYCWTPKGQPGRY